MKKPQKTDAVPVRRRDASGHIDPKYAAELLAKSGRAADAPEGKAFFDGTQTDDELAEQLGEAVIETATSGEDAVEEMLNEDFPEEVGGPFVETSSRVEVAQGTDASNPDGATREPFPRS